MCQWYTYLHLWGRMACLLVFLSLRVEGATGISFGLAEFLERFLWLKEGGSRRLRTLARARKAVVEERDN